MWILAQLLTEITRKPRYKVVAGVNFQWSRESWTHNIFRVYELIFWRRWGIRAESAAWRYGAKSIQVCYSWESAIVLFEARLRSIFKNVPKLKFVKIPLPVLSTPYGQKISPPYLFSIAFESADNGTYNASSQDITWNQTTSGSDELFVTAGRGNTTLAVLMTATVDGNSMSEVNTGINDAGVGFVKLFYYQGLGAGTYAVHVLNGGTGNQLEGCSANYTGVQGGLDNNGTQSTNATNAGSASLTTVADNCWVMMSAFEQGDTLSAGTNTSRRAISPDALSIFDNNAAQTPAGSVTLATTCAFSDNFRAVIASFSPTGGGGATTTPSRGLSLLGVGQ